MTTLATYDCERFFAHMHYMTTCSVSSTLPGPDTKYIGLLGLHTATEVD